MKKTVFLDLGNVILKVNTNIVIQKIGFLLEKNPLEIEKKIDWQLENIYETGQITTQEYLYIINKKYPGTQVFTFENLCNIWEYGFEQIDTTIKYLSELQQKVNLYLLSNTNEIHFTAIERKFQISKYFKKMILSFEVGCRKPNFSIYNKALEISLSEANNSYFIDDLKENIESAKQLGINTLQYTDENSFQNFITQYSLI